MNTNGKEPRERSKAAAAAQQAKMQQETDDQKPDDDVFQASLDSFPASDPPAWIGNAPPKEPAPESRKDKAKK